MNVPSSPIMNSAEVFQYIISCEKQTFCVDNKPGNDLWKASHVNKEDKPLSIDINYTMAAWHFITLSFFMQNGSMSAIFFSFSTF